MLVSHKHEFIYTKTIKTAGTSVEAFFERFCMPDEEWELSHQREETVSEVGIVGHRGTGAADATWYNHMSAADIRERLGPSIWESYYKFCVVRNPFDKAVSIYHYQDDPPGMKGALKTFLRTHSARFLRYDFQRWACGGVPTDRGVYVIDGEMAVDDVIVFEDLQDEVERIARILDLPCDEVTLPRFKTGSRMKKYDVADHYTPASAEAVRQAYAFEIDHFGYDAPVG